MKKIAITTSSFDKFNNKILQLLTEAGYSSVLNPYERKMTENEVKDFLTDVNPVGMIAGTEPLTAGVLKSANSLKVISRCGVGMENVDLTAASALGIVAVNTPDAPSQSVAELTVGLILNSLRNISKIDRNMRRDKWYKPMGRLLSQQTVGVIGLGRIGTKVGELLTTFGAKVIGYDPFNNVNSFEMVSLEVLVSTSDIVTLHVSYTADTHHLVDRSFLEKMKKGATLINTSRGGIVDEDALYGALKDGSLYSAALDVYEDEPYRGKLIELENIILTSHIGSYSMESRIEMERQAVKNLLNEIKNV